MNELFNEKYVYYIPNFLSENLIGRECFVSNSIRDLQYVVNHKCDSKIWKHVIMSITSNIATSQPFNCENGESYTFAYYDPLYDVKNAFLDGEKIQYKSKCLDWSDYDEIKEICNNSETFFTLKCFDDEDLDFRIATSDKLKDDSIDDSSKFNNELLDLIEDMSDRQKSLMYDLALELLGRGND